MILNLIMFEIGDLDTYLNSSDTLDSALSFARGRIGGVVPAMSWIGFGVCLIMIIWCAMKLAMSAGNPQKRDQAMDGIKNILIATAIIGSASTILALAYAFFR